MKTALILNGPPGSGKDTIANELVKRGFSHYQMKDQLYIDTADFFNVSHDVFKILATNRKTKDVQNLLLKKGSNNLSPREALIHVAEHVIKPSFGQGYYGQCTYDHIQDDKETKVVISDGGFREELEPFLDGEFSSILVRLYRKGCTFEHDSREYVFDFPHTVDIDIIEEDVEQTMFNLINAIYSKFNIIV